jgi:predicted ferric reductase
MSLAMILALRPAWPEGWFGGLDKMYRMHKWLGVTALIASVLHWLWIEAPSWAISLGLLQRGERGPRPEVTNPIQVFLGTLRDPAEELGSLAFWAVVVLVALALVKRFPYKWFHKTHVLLAVAWAALAFHTVVLLRFSYWSSPVGWVMAVLLLGGAWAATVALARRIGASRKVPARIVNLQYFRGLRALEIETEAPGWPGHLPGQFVFATSNVSEGAHPYTVASSWHPKDRRIRFVVKELGDHTSKLHEKLRVGQDVTLEGPYGRFTFQDDAPRQIWIGGGVGVTPFIGRMDYLNDPKEPGEVRPDQIIDFFYGTSGTDEGAFALLREEARTADVNMRIFVDERDGYITGERIRAAVPEWREASIWFCGPIPFATALKKDFAAQGFPVHERFHQELFAMR